MKFLVLVLMTLPFTSFASEIYSPSAGNPETRCGVYRTSAHTAWLDDGQDGIDFLDSKLANGVEFPAPETNICVQGVVGKLNGRIQFITISSITVSNPSPIKLVCGTYQSSAHTNWLDDGQDGIDFLDSKIANGVKFPSFGFRICVAGIVGTLNRRTQFKTVDAIAVQPNSSCNL